MHLSMDIVEHQLVGDFSAPLLQCILLRKTNEFVTIAYDKPHYVTVSQHHINPVNNEIKMDQNKHTSFFFTKVIIKTFKPEKSFKPKRSFALLPYMDRGGSRESDGQLALLPKHFPLGPSLSSLTRLDSHI